MEAKAAIEKSLVANSDAIKRINKEIKGMAADKDRPKISKDMNNDSREASGKIEIKCKFYNAGFCKYKKRGCRFVNPENM